MNIIKNEKTITLYPNVKEGKFKNYAFENATVIRTLGKKANLLHRKHKEGKWNMVQMQMDKRELQAYINELQAVCNDLPE